MKWLPHPRVKRWGWRLSPLIVVALWIGWLAPNIPTPRSWETWPAANGGWTPWQPLYQGVEYARANLTVPRPIKAHGLRIHLRAAGVEIFVNPPDPPGSSTCRALYATTFLRRHHLQVVVSAGAFAPFAKWAGTPVDPIGLAVSDGIHWSEPVPNLHGLVFSRDGHARLTRAQADTSDAWQAIGGNWITLDRGLNVSEPLLAEASSFAGISADGYTLYWLIVDGRQPGWSEGVTPSEGTRLLQALGATDVIRMDGGSVVTLATASGWAGAHVLNRPSHPYLTGLQRPLGSLLGIRARPLTGR